MTPVAIFRRARLLLAPLCSTLLLAGPVHAAPDQSIEGASDAGPRTGLKAALPARFKGGAFKFDTQSDESSANADDEAVATPRVDKNDYSLQGSMSSGGGLTLEKGVASWYGKMFHGRKTSSGDPYDMYAMTAAHPTLPIPSYVRVTNLANGRSAGRIPTEAAWRTRRPSRSRPEAATGMGPSEPADSQLRAGDQSQQRPFGGGPGERPRPLPSGAHHRPVVCRGLQARLCRPGSRQG